MAKKCDNCESTKTRWLKSSKNVLGYPMTIYKCSECHTEFSSVRIPNLKTVDVFDL